MRVVVSGYYGFGNHGDEALLAALVQGLARRGHEVRVLSRAPGATRELHRVSASHRLWGVLPALLRADALVSGGGGLLQDTTSARSLDYYLGVIRLARALGKRVAVYGQSVGPLSAAGRRRVGVALRGLPVAVRDRASQRLLADLGVAAELTADPALLLGPPLLAAAPPSAPGAPPPAVGPVLLAPRGGHPDLTDALVALARGLASDGASDGVPLLALGFHPAQDADEVHRIAAALPRGRVGRLLPADIGEALAAVRSARFVVSARLHGLIFAAALDRGHAGLVYDPKVAGFLAESGAPAFHPPVDVDALRDLVRVAPPPAAQRRDALLERAEGGLDWLDGALRARPADLNVGERA